MNGPAKRVGVAAVVCAALLSWGVMQASAAAPPSGAKVSAAAHRALSEIAAEAGYSSWAAYTSAREAEATAREKEAAKIIADALTFGRRVEKDYGEFGGIRARGFTEYVIDWEGGQWYLRTGFEEVFPGFLWLEGRTERWTTYWGDGLTQLGVVKSVIEDGIEKVVAVVPFVPGSIDVKVGDTREAPKPSSSAAGKRPSSWDPKKDGTFGRASGGNSPLRGILDAFVEQAERDRQSASENTGSTGTDNSDPQKPSDDGSTDPQPTSDPGTDPAADDRKTTDSGTQEGHWVWSEPLHDDLTGETYTAYVYRGADGSTTNWGVKTERADGSTHCKSTESGEETECPSGMTDEPSCTTDCARIAVLSRLFFCGSGAYGGAECGQPPEGAGRSETCTYLIDRPTSGSSESADPNEQRPGYDCGEEVNGRMDYGDPNDPNGTQPLDWGEMFIDPSNDGVTDPIEPSDQAEELEDNIVLAMFGTLRDPANPPGTDDETPTLGGLPPGADE